MIDAIPIREVVTMMNDNIYKLDEQLGEPMIDSGDDKDVDDEIMVENLKS